MKRGPQAARIGYFGKLPACADFIKAADNLALAQLLDDWLAQVMNRLSAAPRWKRHYDALQPLQFAFVGTRSRRAIAGQLAASADASQRRYPFLAMSAIEVDNDASGAPGFLVLSPLIMAPLWDAFDPLMAEVLAAASPDTALQAMAATRVEIDPGDQQHVALYADFIERHSIAGLEVLLGRATVRRTIVALGLLLQPVRRSGASRLQNSLVLPLPQAPQLRRLVAAFWLDLVSPFLQQADVELALLIAEIDAQPVLVIGFDGAAPSTLHAVIDHEAAGGQLIGFDDAGWVDALLASDGHAEVRKLSAWLAQGQLSLRSACALLHETLV